MTSEIPSRRARHSRQASRVNRRGRGHPDWLVPHQQRHRTEERQPEPPHRRQLKHDITRERGHPGQAAHYVHGVAASGGIVAISRPILCAIVAALFATMAQRMGREMASLPPLRGYTVNILGSLAGVAAFAVISWLQLSPVWWFGLAFLCGGAAADVGRAGEIRARPRRVTRLACRLCGAAPARSSRSSSCTSWPAARSGRRTTRSPSAGRARHRRRGEQHLPPVDGAGRTEGILLPVAVHGVRRHVPGRADPGRRLGHGCRRGARHNVAPRRRRRDRSRSSSASGANGIPTGPTADPRVTVVNDDARHFLRTSTQQVRPRRLRADRFADDAVELLRGQARELHVHRGIVPAPSAIT